MKVNTSDIYRLSACMGGSKFFRGPQGWVHSETDLR